jgi:hypothetical protein
MTMALKKLPIGVDTFEKIRARDFYYVDKTEFIMDLLDNWSEINLFTRPRRFGKSLNMSMLQAFFSYGCRKELFEGLAISERKDLCETYMGQFPVIFITLKDVEGRNFASAQTMMSEVLGREAARFSFLTDSDRLSEQQKERYQALLMIKNGCYGMSEDVMKLSLRTLSELLFAHYQQQVILLIDEYDVPLDKAYQNGYYDDMVSLIRSMFSSVLKSNPNLFFAALTGCLRISRESIFTGLNNLKVHSITDRRYKEYFGFTDDEVRDLLAYYGLSQNFDTVKQWYDGYQFGNISVYCPWDVINYCADAREDPNVYPQNYWVNTSGNALVRRFVDMASHQTKKEIEQLIAGECVIKQVRQELTYSELDTTIDNLWSVLFATGYLTYRQQMEDQRYELIIPNREIRNLFVEQIWNWFFATTKQDTSKLDAFCEAFPAGEAEAIQKLFSDYLWNTISIRDTAVKKDHKENFYHGVLLGLLSHREDWLLSSNAESGQGYSDILIETPMRMGVVVELKYAENGNLESACRQALAQIEQNHYDARLWSDGMQSVVKYGIACYKKNCMVVKSEISDF